MGSVAFAAMGVASESAQAQSFAFGAGATFPQIVYRQLMDCMYDQAQGSTGKPGPLAKAASCTGFNTSGFHGMILYAPTGSGNGKTVLRTNDKTQIGTPSNSIPYTSSNIGVNGTADYDGVQFVGSDDIVTATDVANWTAGGTTSAQAKYGNLIQLPAVIGAVALGFNGKDGAGANLNILPATPTGGSSGLNLSRNAFCGIASGHITQWNNAILTALNGGTLGTGNITFVHRQDGSGTTFLFSNALVAQCRYEFGPNSETDATVVSYAFPWTDRSQACTTPLLARGANQLNWPDQFTTDQCGAAVANPGGGHFANASGSGSLVALVGSTNGAIGYASQDFWLPVKAGGLKTANLQSQWDITGATGQFQPPTFAGASRAMETAIPQFDNATIRANPLTWSLQGVNPNPVVAASYPISGFSWIEMYQCYQTHSNGNNAYLWFKTWLDYIYGTGSVPIMNDNGFAQVPGVWLTQVYSLLNDSANGPQGSGCTGKVGAY
ncbi:substrate-binding domain-containing protein [Bradyrhizobium erythrophlei]|uniref:substrate-binding domain-containing protein n=1 Tax=Bradyrhizobium erythrophlei TaxID=1437360 RepID=UPI0035EFAA03